jgi:hypothetical protein
MTTPDAFSRAMSIAAAFERANIPYAVGGAIALGIWGVPRGTVDVDVNAFVEADELDRVIEVLQSLGIVLDPERAKTEAAERGMFIGDWEGMRIDVFTPSIAFSHEALRTRAKRSAAGVEAWYLSAEAVSVFKLLFFRSKDIADLERLVAVADVDAAYVRSWMVDMMGEDDVRVAKWDDLVATYGREQG